MFTKAEIHYINGTYDFLGFNTYWTHIAANAEEPPLDGVPGYQKDIRAVVTDDPKWPRGSNGNTVRIMV